MEKNENKKMPDDIDELSVHKDLVNGWSVQQVWHQFLRENDNSRKCVPRNHIWATEVGKGYWERYMKMTGVEPEGKFSGRVLGKFFMGNLIERSLAMVLVMIGVLKLDNKHISIPETKDMIEVTGYLDFLVGGVPKPWAEIEKDPIATMIFSEQLFGQYKPFAKMVHEDIIKKNKKGLRPLIYEIKSINSQVFWAKKDYLREAYKFHIFQDLTYLRATGIKEGRILYVSKDDHVMQEFPVYLNDKELNEEWEKDVKEMTYYIRNKIEPPKPALAVFDKRKKIKFQHNKKPYFIKGCFTDNWQIKWSNYLTQMGFKDLDDYTSKSKVIIAQENLKIKDEFKKKHNLI